MDPAVSTLQVIGRGTCGTVLGAPSSEVAYKKGKDTKSLRNDFRLTNHMAASMAIAKLYLQDAQSTKIFPRIPRCQNFVHGDDRDNAWWSVNGSRFTHDAEYEDDDKPSTIFALDRIFPVPEALRRRLAQMFTNDKTVDVNDPTNEACLIRLYFGRIEPTQQYDSLLNFELHLHQMEQFGLNSQQVERYVSEMALGLAIAHWEAKIDCRDVEFVLGGEPSTNELSMWMLDFDKARRLEFDDVDLMDKLKSGTMGNDPYFPSPTGESQREKMVWKIFEVVYLNTARAILEHNNVERKFKKLPLKFVKAWKTQANENKRAEEAQEDIFE